MNPNTNTDSNVVNAPVAEAAPVVEKVNKKPGRKPSPDTKVTFWVIEGKRVTQKGKPSVDMLKNRRRVTMPKIDAANYNPEIHGYGEVDPADALEITRRETPKPKKEKAAKVESAPVANATMPVPQNSEVQTVSLTAPTDSVVA